MARYKAGDCRCGFPCCLRIAETSRRATPVRLRKQAADWPLSSSSCCLDQSVFFFGIVCPGGLLFVDIGQGFSGWLHRTRVDMTKDGGGRGRGFRQNFEGLLHCETGRIAKLGSIWAALL